MKNNFDLKDYELIQDSKQNHWLFIVVIFLIIGIFILLYKFEFLVYEKQNLIKDNNQFIMIVNSKEINKFEDLNYIYINNKKYKYEITSISKDYSNINDIIYQTIYINPYNYKTDAIITECYILKKKETIYELIFKFIKGGFG